MFGKLKKTKEIMRNQIYLLNEPEHEGVSFFKSPGRHLNIF